MWDTLLHIDTDLFRLINIQGSNAFFDILMPFFRNKYFWIPFYIFLLGLLVQQYKKRSWIIIAGVAVVIGLSDFTSSELIKKSVQRERPCQDELLSSYSNILVRCGTGYSMTSSHATNHMALAVFLFWALGQRFKKIRWPLILWAILVGYAQIYVGVHYPGDVLAGFVLGGIIGFCVYKVVHYFNSSQFPRGIA